MIEPNSELVIDYELVRNNIQVIKTKLIFFELGDKYA